jgi:Flp pilus assembly protein TadG
MSLQLAAIMVPVLFGVMGFAIDLGRLYLIRGELNQTATAMALAAAAQLVGTSASLDNAIAVAQQSLDDTNHLGNKYNFGSLVIGQSTGNLTSTVNAPAFFATVADATGASGSTGTQADGTTARHVEIGLTADAPLLFWGILPVGQSRKTTIAGQALAGISAPLCTACGIVPFAIAALDSSDTVNFGLGDPTSGGLFTFAFECTSTTGSTLGPPTLVGTVVQYVIINRLDLANATLDETQQLYRDAAQGLVASLDPNPTGSPVPLACAGINDASETMWASASPAACATIIAPSASVSEAICGLYSRFDNTAPPAVCSTDVTDFADLSALYLPDTDIVTGEADLYISYTGNGRRIITVPIVDVLATNATSTMTVLGFRQFFLEPNPDGSYPNPADPYGRFVAQYIGSPAPVQQGWFDDHFGLGCPVPVPSGPGKVVLHQ